MAGARTLPYLTPLDVEVNGELDHADHVDVLASHHRPAGGAGHEPAGRVRPDLGQLAQTFHTEDLLTQHSSSRVQSPDCGLSVIRHEEESLLGAGDVPRTHDLLAVHDAGPHSSVLGLSLAQHCGPEDGPGVLVQSHHCRGLLAGALLPESHSGVERVSSLHHGVPHTVRALGRNFVIVSNLLGPQGLGSTVHGPDHHLEVLSRLTLLGKELPDGDPA